MSELSDPNDFASEMEAKWLEAQLSEHQHRLNQVGDIEAEICTGCNYATRASWGKSCEGWVECLKDHERATRARARSGA